MERDVALEQKLIERVISAFVESVRGQFAFVIKFSAARSDDAMQARAFVNAFDCRVSVRQRINQWTEQHAQPVGQPFRKKTDSPVATVPNVGPEIQESMRSHRSANPRADVTTAGEAHSAHRERHEAHEGAAIPQIQFERNEWLQFGRTDFKVEKQRIGPICNQERTPRAGQEPPAPDVFGFNRELFQRIHVFAPLRALTKERLKSTFDTLLQLAQRIAHVRKTKFKTAREKFAGNDALRDLE